VAADNDFNALVNSIEVCTYICGVERELLDENDLAELLSSATGLEIDGEGLMKAGERIFNVEKAFNLREGLRRKDDALSDRYFFEKTELGKTSGLNRARFETMLDEYYEARGWDQEGFPAEETLKRLNLEDIARQLRRLRPAV
jgi:aldehyde:ferredoxin oxidoreductase